MKITPRLLKVLPVIAFAALSFASETPAQQSAKPQVFTDFRSKLALDGYDPVAYFKTGKAVKGSADQAASWNGATWQFSSAENKATFQANPQAYAPQFGGYCAWAVSQGYTARGDPNHWRIVGGKLYVNYNATVQRNWEKDAPGLIDKGEKNWPVVLGK